MLMAGAIAAAAARAFGKALPEKPETSGQFIARRIEKSVFASIASAGDPLDRLFRAGRLYEAALQATDQDGRRSGGSYFTPVVVARHAALEAAAGRERSTFLDPACGTGNLLAALVLLGRIPAARLVGRELDPAAAFLARTNLWLAAGGRPMDWERICLQVDSGDSLQTPVIAADVMVTNPPFVRGVADHGEKVLAEREVLRQRFPLLRGPFDLAAAFWALGEEMCCSRTVLIVPNRLLSAGYTARLRDAAIRRRDSVRLRDFSREKPFASVSVYPVVLTLDRDRRGEGRTSNGQPSGMFHWQTRLLEGRSWGAALSASAMELLEAGPVRLCDIATVHAGQTTGEAYALRPHVGEAGDYHLVTAGAIEPHRIRQSGRQRFLGREMEHPRIPAGALSERRRLVAGSPKLLVSGMGRKVEAALDLDGAAAPAVSVFVVQPREGTGIGLGALSALLNSRTIEGIFRELYGSQTMSGGYISLTKAALEELPVALELDPARFGRLDAIGYALHEIPDSMELLEEAEELVLGLFRKGQVANRIVRAGRP